jgi:rubrerythrin
MAQDDEGADLKDSRTFENLLEAFAGDCKAAVRYRYFAAKAQQEGLLTAANVLEAAAQSKLAHAQGQLEFLRDLGDPQTHAELGGTALNMRSALERATYEHETLYPNFARTARQEGLDVVGQWFESLAVAGKNHVRSFDKVIDTIAKAFAPAEEEAEG